MTQSHIFSTGLSRPQRTELRSSAVSLLSKLKIDQGGYLVDVIAFGGIVRSYTDKPDIELFVKQVGRMPSIGVALGTRRFETIGTSRTQYKSELQLILYFANQHSRDMEIGRHEMDLVAQRNPHADPGLDVMMEHALELIAGQFTQATPTVKQIIPVVEEELVTSPEITVWMQTYDVQLDVMTLSKGREFRTADQMLTAWRARLTTDPAEAPPPAAPSASTTIDVHNPVR